MAPQFIASDDGDMAAEILFNFVKFSMSTIRPVLVSKITILIWSDY